MKLQKILTVSAIFLMILLMISSCRTRKRKTIPCPSFGEYDENQAIEKEDICKPERIPVTQ